MKSSAKTFARNEQARALRARAANANVPIRVDTRPKTVKSKKGKGSYCRDATSISARVDAESPLDTEPRGAGSTGPATSKSCLS